MRAVIIAGGYHPDLMPLTERYPVPLFPLVDRPFIQHLTEFLVDQGVAEFDFILSHLPEKIEALLGDGTRWGSTFRFHLARDPLRPYNLLKTLPLDEAEETILVAHADRLPQIDLKQTRPASPQTAAVLFCRPGSATTGAGDQPQWIGWGWLSGTVIARLPGDLDEALLADHLLSMTASEGLIEVPKLLSIQSFEALLEANRMVLTNVFDGLMLMGTQADQGIWLSRNVSLHPTARLLPPVYLGENCRIGPAVQLGPYAVVERGCILETRCLAQNALIFQGSYVGEGLELVDVIVDRNRLVNVRVGAALSITDDFILGSLSDDQIQPWLGRILSQGMAILLLGLTWPILLLTAFYLKLVRPGPVVYKKEVVRLPTSSYEPEWQPFSLWCFSPDVTGREGDESQTGRGPRHFLFHFLPALINIVKGELRFVGVPSRSKEEIKALPHDWRVLYLRTKAGLVTEAYIHYYGTTSSEDERYSAEAFYAVTAGLRHDLKLLAGYFRRVFTPFRRSETVSNDKP